MVGYTFSINWKCAENKINEWEFAVNRMKNVQLDVDYSQKHFALLCQRM